MEVGGVWRWKNISVERQWEKSLLFIKCFCRWTDWVFSHWDMDTLSSVLLTPTHTLTCVLHCERRCAKPRPNTPSDWQPACSQSHSHQCPLQHWLFFFFLFFLSFLWNEMDIWLLDKKWHQPAELCFQLRMKLPSWGLLVRFMTLVYWIKDIIFISMCIMFEVILHVICVCVFYNVVKNCFYKFTKCKINMQWKFPTWNQLPFALKPAQMGSYSKPPSTQVHSPTVWPAQAILGLRRRGAASKSCLRHDNQAKRINYA